MTPTDTENQGIFKRLKSGLSKTHKNFIKRLDEPTFGKREIHPDMLERLEELLITSDIGVSTVDRLMESIRWSVKRKELLNPEKIRENLQLLKKYGTFVNIKELEEILS